MKNTKKMLNNEELVVELMNFSPCGALCQPFIITALEEYSKFVLNTTEKEWKTPMISLDGWKRQADHILKRLEENYNL